MNIYHQLNEMITYIEQNLEQDISYTTLAKFLGVNEYTMQRLFHLLCNISLSEYIRKRRLSQAGYDLYSGNEKIIDVAYKYGYENATSFSRAFEKFHGVKPSVIKKGKYGLKNYPKLTFEETDNIKEEIPYEIIELEEFVLYGKGISTNEIDVKKDAPNFWISMKKQYCEQYGNISYGMVKYSDRFENPDFEYWVLWDHKIDEFEQIVIPKSKWLLFHIVNDNSKEIQQTSRDFYEQFLPSCKYNIRDIPELEHYHDGVVDFLVPIE